MNLRKLGDSGLDKSVSDVIIKVSRNAKGDEGNSNLREVFREQPAGGKAVCRWQMKTGPEPRQGCLRVLNDSGEIQKEKKRILREKCRRDPR